MDAALVEDDLSKMFHGFCQDSSILAEDSSFRLPGHAWPDPISDLPPAALTESSPSSSKSGTKGDAPQDQPASPQAMSRESRLQKNRQ